MEDVVVDGGSAAAAGGAGAMLVPLIVGIIMIAALWRIFSKAGKPGWASIIPIYNAVVMLQVAGKPGWWVILMFIPVVNFIVGILAMIGLAQNFGKGTGFTIGLILLGPIFMLILGFGGAQYLGAGAAPAAAPAEVPAEAPAEAPAAAPEEAPAEAPAEEAPPQ